MALIGGVPLIKWAWHSYFLYINPTNQNFLDLPPGLIPPLCYCIMFSTILFSVPALTTQVITCNTLIIAHKYSLNSINSLNMKIGMCLQDITLTEPSNS